MSNVTPLRPPPGGASDPHHGSGWAWDGNDWYWAPHPEHPISGSPPPLWWQQPPGSQPHCPPPCPPPIPCPPPPCPPHHHAPCGPPSCFSAVAKADACWDQSQALYNLITKVVMDIFEKNPGIIPVPPGGAGAGPIIGVTDGSSAAPGEVGEYIWKLVETTGWSVAQGASQNRDVFLITLPPGDWDIAFTVQIQFAFTGGGWNTFPTAQIVPALGSSLFAAGGEVGGQVDESFPSAFAQVSSATSVAVVITISVQNENPATSTGSTFTNVMARRRR